MDMSLRLWMAFGSQHPIFTMVLYLLSKRCLTANYVRHTGHGILARKALQTILQNMITRSWAGNFRPFVPLITNTFIILLCPVMEIMGTCLLYTSDAADERSSVDLG